MQHTRTWTDIYRSAHASFEGRAGGHPWLVAAPAELAADLPAALAAVDGKGTVELIVHDGLTPLLAALKEVTPRGVLIIGKQALASGPEVTVPETLISDAGGVEYAEGGTFPAWAASTELKTGKRKGQNAAASAVASLDVPVVVTTAATVQRTLEDWMDSTPHGR
ncbi:hypothetical protein [Deinococcus humi]|uniref:Uncharacterized protein n=1 Tax=Deinococcus humi TaxID=662880 RepID=A0A7W8JWG4_9DEIO|nr:hypothetical protein [Deinococcus humi]MBB5363213.1 hypothetical protein [Deinococcus humi]GGO27652.1 hypothetical protein GCM10008949_19540 [Deinococcus humi]